MYVRVNNGQTLLNVAYIVCICKWDYQTDYRVFMVAPNVTVDINREEYEMIEKIIDKEAGIL